MQQQKLFAMDAETCQRSGARVGLICISGILHRSLDDTHPPSLIQIDSHATRHELLASLSVLPHFWCVQMHLRPLALMGACFAAPDSHVGPHWKRFLLSSYLPIAVEQNGPAALVLMQQTAVLEVGHQGDLALHRYSQPVRICDQHQIMSTHVVSK